VAFPGSIYHPPPYGNGTGWKQEKNPAPIYDDDLVDAYEWLLDCDGEMAMENNPRADDLVKAGLAKEGGLDKFGRRLLVLDV